MTTRDDELDKEAFRIARQAYAKLCGQLLCTPQDVPKSAVRAEVISILRAEGASEERIQKFLQEHSK